MLPGIDRSRASEIYCFLLLWHQVNKSISKNNSSSTSHGRCYTFSIPLVCVKFRYLPKRRCTKACAYEQDVVKEVRTHGCPGYGTIRVLMLSFDHSSIFHLYKDDSRLLHHPKVFQRLPLALLFPSSWPVLVVEDIYAPNTRTRSVIDTIHSERSNWMEQILKHGVI